MSDAMLEAADEMAAQEALHALGCTDGLPVIVPTAERMQEIARDSVIAWRWGETGLDIHEEHLLGGGSLVAVLGMLIDEALADAPALQRALAGKKPRGKAF